MSNNGSAILQAVHIVQQVGGEADALVTMIERAIADPASWGAPGSTAAVRFGKPQTDAGLDASGYLYDHQWLTAQAKRNTTGRGKKPVAGEFSILLDFGRKNGVASVLNFPCAVAAWSIFESGWDFGEDFWNYWPPRHGEIELLASRLFWWTESAKEKADYLAEQPIDSQWFYVVPLTALRDERAARELLLTPALTLLAGAEAEAALDYPQICRFTWPEGDDPPVVTE